MVTQVNSGIAKCMVHNNFKRLVDLDEVVPYIPRSNFMVITFACQQVDVGMYISTIHKS